ncbi:MAG: phosphate ABC transporter permease PstA [bacterium]|nr:phosphate ABC transporter permease PstA [bacterium]
MKDAGLRYRLLKDRFFKAAVILLALAVLVPLLLILYHIVRNGIAVVNWEFLTSLPKPMGDVGGGIANALVGTIMLVIVAAALAVPPGICAGIYLAESKSGRLAAALRTCMDILQGIPSIVIGIIAYAWVVVTFGTFSAFSGGIALAVMMLPVIVRATEETLKLIPENLREASLALGVPYSKTILKVVVPSGLSGILTGIMLGMARIAGETAPLLFTAFGSPFMNLNIFKPVDSLPLMIFNYATSPYPEWHSMAWGASFVLVVFVLSINFFAKVISAKWKVRF